MERDNLSDFESIELLEAFIEKYNSEQDEALEQREAKEIATSIMNADKREIKELKLTVSEQSADIAQQKETIAQHVKLQRAADRLVDKFNALELENANHKTMINGLKNELNVFKGQGNPKKLREQIKRIKAKSEDKTKRVTALENEAKQYRSDIKKLSDDIRSARVMIETNNVNGQHGVYHNGDDHLIRWDEPITALDSDGNKTKSVALLHMRKCGTGRMILLDDNNDIVIAKPSRYSIKKETESFAMSWLYRVNRTQNGVVRPADLVPVNYNQKIDPNQQITDKH